MILCRPVRQCGDADYMRRRTLDILFSAGGVLLAGLLLAIGVVLTSNASFANNYVTTQLTQQQITFPTVAGWPT